MDSLDISTTSKMLSTLRKIQFVSEFIIMSKFGQASQILPEFLMTIEACKFYYKAAGFAEQENLHLEHNPLPEEEEVDPIPKDPLQKMNSLLEKIKQRPYETNKFQDGFFEKLPCGKQVQIVNTKPVPQQLKKNNLKFKHIIGEILLLLRPLISIVAIRVLGQENFKAYLISLAIDLLMLFVLQRGITVTNSNQAKELSDRRKDVIYRYLFRKPFYLLLKNNIIEPALKMVIKEERIVYRLIMGVLDMQSTITLTL